MAALGGWVLVICLSLSAQGSTPDALLDFMYAKFVAAFPASKDSPEFLMLTSPGISLDPDSLKTPSFEISDLLDQVPQASRTYHPSGNHYSMIYERILDSAFVTKYQLSANRDAALRAKRTLFNKSRPGQPTPEYAAYLKGQAEYAAALDAQSLAQEESRATGTRLPSGLDQAVTAARKRWEAQGYEAPIRKALDALQQLYDSNAQMLFQNLRYDFLGSRLRGDQAHTWLPVTTHPPVEQWLTGQGWHPLSFHQTDLKAPPAKGTVPVPSDRARPDDKATSTWSSTMALTVEFKRVVVSRPWMDTAVFSAHTWMLKDDAGFTLVSTGNPADPNPGPMPILITGILLARKLALTGYQTRVEANGGTRIPDRLGPFNLGGPQPGRRALTRRIAQTAVGASITVAEPQIIAFFCRVIPKSPSPDPKYFK